VLVFRHASPNKNHLRLKHLAVTLLTQILTAYPTIFALFTMPLPTSPVEPTDPATQSESVKTLSDFPLGSQLRVVGYAENSAYITQLQRLGLVPGTKLAIERLAPLGDPMQIRLRNFTLALRPSEATALLVQLIS
jgi:Fe2+ transport system protein FeoA